MGNCLDKFKVETSAKVSISFFFINM